MDDLTNALVRSLKAETIKTKVEIDTMFFGYNTGLGHKNHVFFLEVKHVRN